MTPTPDLEQRILEAAKSNDDCMLDLLQEAIENIADDEQVELLLDKVLQAQKEEVSDLTGWRWMQP